MDPDRNELLRTLLADSARRDQVAFARLYDATAAKLFAVAVRMLKREDWAEEVLQECYVSIWQNAHKYTTALSAPMTWMISIVRNRCLDRLRRPKLEVVLEPSGEGDDPLERMPSDAPSPLEQLASSTEARALSQCLEALEGKMRQAIALAFYEGLSHAELAQHMREPLGTVKTWIRRGLERLKTCLSGAEKRFET